jgi:glycine betaine/proline transport system permease protein
MIRSQRLPSQTILLLGLGLIVILLLIHHLLLNFGAFPDAWDIHLRDPIDAFKSWVISNRTTHPIFLLFFEPISDAIDFSLRRLEDFLLWLPWSVLAAAIFLLAQKVANLQVALLATFSLLFMGLVGLWEQSMETLALMGVSVFISLLIGIPLGILSARHDKFEMTIRPILDAMQTMPAFVYLIPVLLFFGVARVPSVVATLIYAIPPAIRLTALGIRQVPPEIIEAAQAFGSTPRQILYKVQLPLAMPSIMAGVNQTIMMALSIVVIAALIGAGGLGKEVYDALRGLRVGLALEAGLAIVFLAVLLDRVSQAFAEQGQGSRHGFRLLPQSWGRYEWAQTIEAGLSRLYAAGERFSAQVAGVTRRPFLQRHAYFFTSLLILLLLLAIGRWLDMTAFPDSWRLPIRGPIDTAVAWMRDNLYEQQIGTVTVGTGPLSSFIVLYLLNPLDTLLQEWLAWPIIVVILATLAWALSGWRLAVGTAVTLLGMGFLGMWELAMVTLGQVIVAVGLSLLIAIPLGIWAARSNTAEAILRPVVDFLQTIPTFVYLVPVIMLFDVGRVPGIMASVLYALPPAIRLTNLGIRRADPEAVEAAQAFGSTYWQALTKVQLPLALPTIMAGINQTVMMVLAMVVIAGMVGGAGLGLEAVNGLARNQLGQGIEAGLAIVFMAIVLDRLLQAWAERQREAANLR